MIETYQDYVNEVTRLHGHDPERGERTTFPEPVFRALLAGKSPAEAVQGSDALTFMWALYRDEAQDVAMALTSIYEAIEPVEKYLGAEHDVTRGLRTLHERLKVADREQRRVVDHLDRLAFASQ